MDANLPHTFWNLTNHPVASSWGQLQRAAAETYLGPSQPLAVKDLPFPHVDPRLGTDELGALAAATLDRLRAMGAVPGEPVLVMGEMGLLVALVPLLRKAGFLPLHTTSERQALERLGADGTLEKHQCFRFLAFRPYPSHEPVEPHPPEAG